MSNTGFALVDNVQIDTFEQFINIGVFTHRLQFQNPLCKARNDNSELKV